MSIWQLPNQSLESQSGEQPSYKTTTLDTVLLKKLPNLKVINGRLLSFIKLGNYNQGNNWRIFYLPKLSS